MGTDQLAANKQVVRRLYQDLFTRGRLELTGELISEDYVNHDPPPGRGHTRADVRATAASFRERLTDLTASIDRHAAEGDLVAVQATITGTVPSGERTQIRMSEFFRLENGRIAERWS